jgi:hypothetical protein
MVANLGLFTIRSRLAEGIMFYFDRLLGRGAAPPPPYLGERRVKELFIWPDVLVRDPSRNGRMMETGTAARKIDGMGSPDAAKDLLVEAGNTYRRVPWFREGGPCEISTIRKGEHRGGLILGDPGMGKSQLCLATLQLLAGEGKKQVEERAVHLDAVSIPVVCRCDSLAKLGLADNISVEAALRAALSRMLDAAGCPERASAFILERLPTGQVWLILDAVDEVPPAYNGTLRALLSPVSAWSTVVIATSRSPGYQELGFIGKEPFREYRLAPFTRAQSLEFINKFFA